MYFFVPASVPNQTGSIEKNMLGLPCAIGLCMCVKKMVCPFQNLSYFWLVGYNHFHKKSLHVLEINQCLYYYYAVSLYVNDYMRHSVIES